MHIFSRLGRRVYAHVFQILVSTEWSVDSRLEVCWFLLVRSFRLIIPKTLNVFILVILFPLLVFLGICVLLVIRLIPSKLTCLEKCLTGLID